jgi:hypothetical protein
MQFKSCGLFIYNQWRISDVVMYLFPAESFQTRQFSGSHGSIKVTDSNAGKFFSYYRRKLQQIAGVILVLSFDEKKRIHKNDMFGIRSRNPTIQP